MEGGEAIAAGGYGCVFTWRCIFVYEYIKEGIE